MDTAAPWCIFEGKLGAVLSRCFEPVREQVTLSTRLFVSPDWTGPNFIGYEGLLQRIRFAIDPEANLFYFGRI